MKRVILTWQTRVLLTLTKMFKILSEQGTALAPNFQNLPQKSRYLAALLQHVQNTGNNRVSVIRDRFF